MERSKYFKCPESQLNQESKHSSRPLACIWGRITIGYLLRSSLGIAGRRRCIPGSSDADQNGGHVIEEFVGAGKLANRVVQALEDLLVRGMDPFLDDLKHPVEPE